MATAPNRTLTILETSMATVLPKNINAFAQRHRAPRISIQYATGISWLGATLVAGTELGICAILFNDDPAALLPELRERFPSAEILAADETFAMRAAKVLSALEEPGAATQLPLDIIGTEFQRRVWQELQKIPAGVTATYAEIAGRIGQPQAARAIARACATNHIAVAVPCHRVIRSDGRMAGYRWGVERKHRLLEREGTQISE
jgi:AraC family transcriptional regulator of adaptative response/methylated-DNA-[protein]-cysteine methyltransferase